MAQEQQTSSINTTNSLNYFVIQAFGVSISHRLLGTNIWSCWRNGDERKGKSKYKMWCWKGNKIGQE